MRDVKSGLAGMEHCLANVERLLAEGNAQFAMLSLDLYGPDFESQLDQGQAERLRIVMQALGDGRLDGPIDASQSPFGMH